MAADGAPFRGGFIISKMDNGNYAFTLTAVAAGVTAEQLEDLFDYLSLHEPLSIQQIDEAIARDGNAVVGAPARLSAEEQALCVW